MVDLVETYPWGSLIWHRHGQLLAGTMQVGAGKSCGRHLHDNATEMVVVTAGRAKLHIGNDIIALEAGMSHEIPINTPHELVTAPGETATVLIVFDNPDRAYIPLLQT